MQPAFSFLSPVIFKNQSLNTFDQGFRLNFAANLSLHSAGGEPERIFLRAMYSVSGYTLLWMADDRCSCCTE